MAWAFSAPSLEPSEKVRAMDVAVDAADPEIVIVGNSIARVSLDEERLAAALGVPGRMVRLSVDGFTSAGWYTLLKHRVYGRGHRPKLVIIPNTPWFALLSEPNAPLSRARLAEQLTPDDGEVLAKLGRGGGSWWMERALRHRQELKDAILSEVKHAALAPFAADDAEGEALLASVFEREGAVDFALHRAAMPIVEVDAAAASTPKPSLQTSMMAELVELVTSNGGRVLFINVPLAPGALLSLGDVDAERDLVGLFNDAPGSGYLDMTGLSVPPSAFSDPLHLNSFGRGLLTDAVIAWWSELGEGLDVEFPEALAPLVPVAVARVGTPDALPSIDLLPAAATDPPCCRRLTAPDLAGLADDALLRLGVHAVSPIVAVADGARLAGGANYAQRQAGCSGVSAHRAGILFACPSTETENLSAQLATEVPLRVENHPRPVWWVYPGTTLQITLPAAPVPTEAHAVWVRVSGEGSASWAVDGVPQEALIRGRRSSGTVVLPANREVTLSWTVPPGGAWTLVQALAVEQEGQLRAVVGTVQELSPGPLPMLAVKGDVVKIRRDEVPNIVEPDGELKSGPVEGVALWPSKLVGSTTDHARLGRFAGATCAPIELREDGVPLALPNLALAELKQKTPGGWLGRSDGLIFVGSDGSDPRTNGRAYTVHWIADIPGRRCLDAEWVHPGGKVVLTHTAPAAMLGGARGLEIRMQAFGEAVTGVQIVVRAGGREYARLQIPAELLDAIPHHLPLAWEIPHDAVDVEVEVEVPATGAHLLIQALALTDHAPDGAEVQTPDVQTPSTEAEPSEAGAPPALALALSKTPLASLTASEGGLVYEETAPSPQRACLPSLGPSARVVVQGRARVIALRDSRSAFQTAAVVVRFLDGSGEEVERAPGKPGVLVHRLTETAWSDVQVRAPVPAGTAQIEVCVDFTGAAGAVEIAALKAVGE